MFLPYNTDRPLCRSFLVPLVQTQYTYVRDTNDFINKIESMHLDPDTRLITYDVTFMYTNMTATELVQSAAKALTKLKQNEVTKKNPTCQIFS